MDSVPFKNPASPVAGWDKQINAIATATAFPACALAATVEVESAGRNVLQEGMPAGPGCGVGLCQITEGVDWKSGIPTWNGRSLLVPDYNLAVAVSEFLKPALSRCLTLRESLNGEAALMSRWSPNILFFVFIAYNVGFEAMKDAILAGDDPDAIDTERYGARAYAAYERNCEASHRAFA